MAQCGILIKWDICQFPQFDGFQNGGVLKSPHALKDKGRGYLLPPMLQFPTDPVIVDHLWECLLPPSLAKHADLSQSRLRWAGRPSDEGALPHRPIGGKPVKSLFQNQQDIHHMDAK